MSHTPGPWEVAKGSDNCPSDFADEPIYGAIKHDDWHIARIWSDRPNHEDDARLIAAAPDLLAALERCKEILFPEPVNGISDDAYYNLMGVQYDMKHADIDGADHNTIRRVLGQLNQASNVLAAAIAKAKGEA